ncbi:MAG: hypothetical protein J0L84_12845 [Verrucomicrobia bacterium]|nr:hypothetical protein [Verrucomicrobiota bacterium]
MEMLTSRVPLLGWVLAGPGTLYGLMLLARWIGLSYCAQRHRIGWE